LPPDLQGELSVSDRERPIFTRVNGTLLGAPRGAGAP